MIDLEPRRQQLQGKLRELVAAYHETQQILQQTQAEIWKAQGKLELLRDLQTEANASPARQPDSMSFGKLTYAG